jgi:hypothetical protein
VNAAFLVWEFWKTTEVFFALPCCDGIPKVKKKFQPINFRQISKTQLGMFV